jgi:hypothetical protein
VNREIQVKARKRLFFSFPTMNLLLILLGSLAIVARAQRPLNTTTNGTSVLMEPFFVKPTGKTPQLLSPEQRGGGSTYYQNIHDSPGIRNKERAPPPHLDAFVTPLNTVGGQQSAQPVPAPNNRLHKVQKARVNKFSVIREMTRNSNFTKSFPEHSIGKKVSKPEPFVDDGQHDGTDPKDPSRPSSKGEAIQKIKDMQRAQDNQHTPSPPSYSVDDIDFDEKLGVKCSFEKPCAWTFDPNVNGTNFEVTTGVSLKDSNVTGQ